MKYVFILISFIIAFHLFGIETSTAQEVQTSPTWVDADSVGIGDVFLWKYTIFYPDILRFIQPGSNFDVQQYEHPIYPTSMAFVVRHNTMFSFQSIIIGETCYTGLPLLVETKHATVIGSIRYKIDKECVLYNSTISHINAYLKEVEARRSKSLDKLN